MTQDRTAVEAWFLGHGLPYFVNEEPTKKEPPSPAPVSSSAEGRKIRSRLEIH